MKADILLILDDDDADPYASIKDVTRETGGIQFTPGGADHRSKGIDEMPRSQRLVSLHCGP